MIKIAPITTAPPDYPIVHALREVLRVVFVAHGVQRCVLYCRISPMNHGMTSSSILPGIERQVQVLERFVPAGYAITVLRDVYVSAYDPTSGRNVIGRANQGNEKFCLFSTSLDRVTRREDDLRQIRKTLQNNLAMCFAWDWQSQINALDAIGLQECSLTKKSRQVMLEWNQAMATTRRFKPHRSHGALLQPVLWHAGNEGLLPHKDHIKRHSRNAKAYACSVGNAYSGPAKDRTQTIPSELTATSKSSNSRVIDSERQQNFISFAGKTFYEI